MVMCSGHCHGLCRCQSYTCTLEGFRHVYTERGWLKITNIHQLYLWSLNAIYIYIEKSREFRKIIYIFLSFQVDFAVIASQAGATLNNLLSHAQELVSKLRSLQLDQREFVCLKFLVLFSLGESRMFVWKKGKCAAGLMLRMHREHKYPRM